MPANNAQQAGNHAVSERPNLLANRMTLSQSLLVIHHRLVVVGASGLFNRPMRAVPKSQCGLYLHDGFATFGRVGFFPQCLFQDGVIQAKIGDHFAQLVIFTLHFFHLPCLLSPHPFVFFPPTVIGLIADPECSAYLTHSLSMAGQQLCFAQFVDDIFCTECLFLPSSLLLLKISGFSLLSTTYLLDQFLGQGTAGIGLMQLDELLVYARNGGQDWWR